MGLSPIGTSASIAARAPCPSRVGYTLAGVKSRFAKTYATPLRDSFELVLHYERGYWEEMGSAAVYLAVSEDAVPALYLESVDWA